MDGEAGLDPADVRDEGISNSTDEMKKCPRELLDRAILSPDGVRVVSKICLAKLIVQLPITFRSDSSNRCSPMKYARSPRERHEE